MAITGNFPPTPAADSETGGNIVYRFTNTAIVAVEHVDAPHVVTSAQLDDAIGETLTRLGLAPGMLANVAGIQERRWYDDDIVFSDAAAEAGAAALAAAGVPPARIGLLIDTSVSRARLEPSEAVAVHNSLGLGTHCLNFDLSNACLGFVNGMTLAAIMIDAGQIDYALIVDAESARTVQEATLARLAEPSSTPEDIFSDFATLTLGSGAVAMVLGRASDHPDRPRLVGGVGRAATEHNQLCQGDMERMVTDTKRLLTAGLEVAAATMADAAHDFDWADMDHYILHQVSTVHCSALTAQLGIDSERVPLTFPTRGNIGPAAIPITLSIHQNNIRAGDRVLLMGMGSGINAAALEIAW